ncbi:Endonuclease/exonuclease/phosphatase [Cubamyces menziesii]|nr:Endonuclease/exonuclease/phosphatase [Cubamyces menziesii]
MKILSWNINGIRTLPKYHPWNSFKTCEGILDELKADIICFQEMKSSRATLPRDVALPGHFHSFFSFPVNKGGYSGVAVYTDSHTAVPVKAEEGISGRLQPQPPLSAEERVSPSYPRPDEMTLYADEEGEVPSTFDALDAEGRALVLDFGLFVLINVYCPNETSDARLSFKMNYHLMLQERVRRLIEEEHREVIVLGDINICSTPLDHCDGHLPSSQATFYDHPARAWFRKWLSPNGPMIDIVRSFWPDRKGMFTCWNMKLQARETNYGARIDYILVTKGLLPWIQHGDILPSLKGSDHCPIYIDLRDEITLESGETVRLCDAMKQTDGTRDPPRIAAKFWDEFSGKQTVLSSFFGKRPESQTKVDPTESLTASPPTTQASTPNAQGESVAPSSQSKNPEASGEVVKKFKPSQPFRPLAAPATKRKAVEQSANSSKKRKHVKGQASIATFFSKPPTSSPTAASSKTQKTQEVIEIEDDAPTSTPPSTLASALSDEAPSSSQAAQDQLEADYRLACELAKADAVSLSADDEPAPSPSSSSQPQAQKKAAWSQVFAPVPPPNCLVHGEPTKLWTVNKQGPNKGKKFYLCSRPVGPGYDKGKGERLRDEVDHQYRCNYFKWASDVRKEAQRERERERTRTKSGEP